MFWVNCNIGPPSDKTNETACASSEDSDQPGHPPSLIRVFSVCVKKAWVLSYSLSTQWRLWSDWADVQTDLSLCWAHSHFIGFVTRRLIWRSFPRQKRKDNNNTQQDVELLRNNLLDTKKRQVLTQSISMMNLSYFTDKKNTVKHISFLTVLQSVLLGA